MCVPICLSFVCAFRAFFVCVYVCLCVCDVRAYAQVAVSYSCQGLQTSSGDPVLLLGDETRVKQIMVNFLSNALKFSQAGGSVRVDIIARRARDDDHASVGGGSPGGESGGGVRSRSRKRISSSERPRTGRGAVRSDDSDSDMVDLSIACVDTGIGMSPDNVERLFKPFTQVHTGTRRLYVDGCARFCSCC